jgi:hypothetical protein
MSRQTRLMAESPSLEEWQFWWKHNGAREPRDLL